MSSTVAMSIVYGVIDMVMVRVTIGPAGALLNKGDDTEHGYAEVEVVAAVGTGKVDSHHAAVVVYDGRAALALHGGYAVHHPVAIGLLGNRTAGELGAYAAVGLCQGYPVVVAYHV